MNALNEVNKVISSVSYYTHRHGNPEEEEWLTAERMAVSHTYCLLENVVSFGGILNDRHYVNVLYAGVDSAEQYFVYCAARQSSSATICGETREDPALRH